MEVTGRLTADATISVVKEEKKVVNFSIAINDSYRSNGETKRITTFIECAYWLNAGIANYLKKGMLVQLGGRIGSRAYITKSGEPKSTLTFLTNNVKFLSGAAGNPNATEETGAVVRSITPALAAATTDDDLPF